MMDLKQVIATNKWAQRLGGKAYDVTLPRAGYSILDRESLRAGDGVCSYTHAFGNDDRLSLVDCQSNHPPTYH